MKKWLLGGLGTMAFGVVVAAVIYPEDFAMVLVGLVLGLFLGITQATVLMESYFHKGATMTHDLQKQQVVNPAKIMYETRMAVKEENKAQAAKPKQQNQSKPIPQFKVTGLN